jgi:uncharacterized lipoprotein YddW (UPF0748 family)
LKREVETSGDGGFVKRLKRVFEFSTLVAFIVCAFLATAVNLTAADSAIAERGIGVMNCVPVGGAASPPRRLRGNGGVGVRLDCRFQDAASGSRAAWDFPVSLDMRRCGGLRFRVSVPDLTPFSYFTVYFKSGAGWYVSEFSVAAEGVWQTMEIRKGATRIEGSPVGWGDISAIRISAWRGASVDGVVDVAGFELLPARSEVLVLRGTSGFAELDAGEKSAVLQYSQRIEKLLAAYQIAPRVVDEGDLDRRLLVDAKVLVLPYNPRLPGECVNLISEFVSRGGKVLGFYVMPESLAGALGMKVAGFISAKKVSGGLDRIEIVAASFAGAPSMMPQRSWMTSRLAPVPGAAVETLGIWRSGRGATLVDTPAILASGNAVWFGHVLLNENPGEGGLLLLAALGRLWDGAWRVAATGARTVAQGDLPYSSFPRACREIADLAANEAAVKKNLNAAIQAWNSANASLTAHAYPQAVGLFNRATKFLTDAYFHSRRNKVREFKAAWCHSGDGAGGGWHDSIRRFRVSGFNAMFANVMNAGMAWFPTHRLPGSASVERGGDPMRDFVDACREYGVQAHAWVMCFRIGDNPAPGFVARMKKAQRLQQGVDGKINEQWLCPNNPENQRMLLDAIDEMVAKYAIAGVHLDYIRYPGPDFCFCPECRARFEKSIGRSVADWPRSVRGGGRLNREWLEFRRQSINRFVAVVRGRIKKVRPKVFLSAAVFRNEVSARDSIGQDWPHWAKRRWVDFVCPMNYTNDVGAFRHSTLRQLRMARELGVPLFPGIGLSSHNLGAVGAIEQIEASRALGTSGFVIFQFNKNSATNEFADFAKGVTGGR